MATTLRSGDAEDMTLVACRHMQDDDVPMASFGSRAML